MTLSDPQYIAIWWLMFLTIGTIFLPFTSRIFSNFFDRGYIFSKIIGIVILSYVLFLVSSEKLLPISSYAIWAMLAVAITINFMLLRSSPLLRDYRSKWKIFFFEEALFLIGIVAWSFIRGTQPDINGLEKFMDFGFINSVLRSSYLPATDMWFPPLPINYYYFGHFMTAILTKLSSIPSYITYNLMLSTIFAFTFTCSFSIGINLLQQTKKLGTKIAGGLLSALLVSLAGNLHTLYAFFSPYPNESPQPLWDLLFSPQTFPNHYWYPNATRFIPFTIHEFPAYSFVVSDLHGHVLALPIILTLIALFLNLYTTKNISYRYLFFIALFLSVAYMTNAWDLPIYLLLGSSFIWIVVLKKFISKKRSVQSLKGAIFALPLKFYARLSFHLLAPIVFLLGIIGILSFPFNYYFQPFASKIGVLCAPKFLIQKGSIGPLLFEADHCQHSPWWQLLILYGFFYIFLFSLLLLLRKNKRLFSDAQTQFVLILSAVATILLILPELVYAKDIYPAHYRANTMFKLAYQAFIMLSLLSSYSIITILKQKKNVIFYSFSTLLVGLVIMYSYFAVTSYYGSLEYKGLDGIAYLKNRYPSDHDAIGWIQKNVKGQPIILEAQGDSYTDYARISANTGLPTVLGWTVHEWLWRGDYSIPAPRVDDIKTLYESNDSSLTKSLIDKYDISYVYIGSLEHEKYPLLEERKFNSLGSIVYQNSGATIYKIN